MKSISESVTRIAGHRGNRFYATLICMVNVATASMPAELSMQEICRRTSLLCGKSVTAVSQDASRAVQDIWEYGSRQELIKLLGRDPKVKPSPKDLVIELAQIFWNQFQE